MFNLFSLTCQVVHTRSVSTSSFLLTFPISRGGNSLQIAHPHIVPASSRCLSIPVPIQGILRLSSFRIHVAASELQSPRCYRWEPSLRSTFSMIKHESHSVMHMCVTYECRFSPVPPPFPLNVCVCVCLHFALAKLQNNFQTLFSWRELSPSVLSFLPVWVL